MLIEICSAIIFITIIIGFVPQIYKSFKTKSTDSLSIVIIVNYFVCSGILAVL